MRFSTVIALSAAMFLCVCACSDEVRIPASNEDEPGAAEGSRPYEMEWVNRTAPAHPELVDFEDMAGWQVRCVDGAEATLCRSKQEKLFGAFTGKVVYHGTSASSRFTLEPSAPIPIPEPFTAVDLWVRGNNWGWIDPPATARVTVRALVCDSKNEMYRIDLGVVDCDYWFLLHATCVSPNGQTRLYEPIGTPNDGVIDFPASFVGLEVSGCSSREPARLFFDALSFYTMAYPPLTFEEAPAVLPWPTTTDTILPTCKKLVTFHLLAPLSGGAWSMEASDGDDRIRYTYKPGDGTLGDITVEAGGQSFQPCWKGGIAFQAGGREVRPGDAGVQTALIEQRDDADGCAAAWRLTAGQESFEYQYVFHVRGKSLIIDASTKTGDATQLDIGLARGLQAPKTVFFPYLTYGDDWPKTVCSMGSTGAVFVLSLLDYYHSNASELFGAPRVRDENAAGYTGGAVYHPTTAGVRNPLSERIFVNISRDVQEVLPNIPNPDSDTRDTAKEYVWRNIGALFQNEMLLQYKGYGIDKFIACHHEVGWREGGESFTQRDRPATSIGDDRLKEYSAFVRGLGYRFGTYTNYVDFAPVNANWNENDVCLNSDGSWQRAWPRCYAFKPSRAPEREADYAKRIHERYGTTAQYCDVQTAYTPWGRTDYDARTPGAGMFRTQFNAFGRLLYNESTAHDGPVFSEGNYHWFYAGIVDGDYATIVPYGRGWEFAPLVDFDLLKMHPKMTDFGMGMPQMYYGTAGEWMKDRSVCSPFFDRFHAATIAFGHIGFLADDWGLEGTIKSYYLLQALQQRYVSVGVKSIQYFDGKALVDTSEAIAAGGYDRRQVRTEYDNGLVVWWNLHSTEDWNVEIDGVAYTLPPGGFAAFKADDILAYSARVGGLHHELVWCRQYLYLDTRDELVETPVVTTRGRVAIKPDGEHAWWVIPATKCEEVTIARAWLGVGADAVFTATACTLDGKPVGAATLLAGVDSVTIVPGTDASQAKYRLTVSGTHAPAITALRFGARAVLTTNTVPVTITVALATDAAPSPLTVEWSCGRATGEPFKRGTADLVRSEDKGSASCTIDVPAPKEAPVHQRCWYSFQPSWLGAEEARWGDAIPLPPFDITMPTGEFMVESHKPFDMGANTLSHLPGAVTAAFRLQAHGILEKDLGREVFVKSEEIQPLIWRLRLPDVPVSATLRMTASGASQTAECTRYLRTRPTTWCVADLTRLPLVRGTALRGTGEITYDAAVTGGLVDVARDALGGQMLDSIFMHPPYKTGVGYVSATYTNVALPQGRPTLAFSLGFRQGCSTHDGCVFKVIVMDQNKEKEVFSESYASLGAWASRSVALSEYAGHTISIRLIADVGPKDDSYSDWALWGAPKIVMREPAWNVELGTEKSPAQFGPSPQALGKLKVQELVNVRSAAISFETCGVDGGLYASSVCFNGIAIGDLPPSGSDREWRTASISIPQEALGTVRFFNTLVVKNPGGDSMKIRNACLHFELSDGRQGASLIDLGPYCSDTRWAFAEGNGVARGDDLPEIVLCIPSR